jgi:phosphohistidine phosphatase SixA
MSARRWPAALASLLLLALFPVALFVLALMPAPDGALAQSQRPPAAPETAGGPGEIAVSELARPNVVVILRHASAPGVNDPPGFRLEACETQRNLDAAGRRQAAELGATWKAAGFRPTRIWSSAWCRCLDTARLIDLGPVTVLPELNARSSAGLSREAQAVALNRFIDRLDPRGGPYLMVTHQFVITALTGLGADSAGGVVVELPAGNQGRQTRVLPAPSS